MGNLIKILKENNINIENFQIFVETGFYAGENFNKLYSGGYFEKIESAYSIEIFESFVLQGKKDFLYFNEDKFNLIFGDSPLEIKKIIDENKSKKILFWLDAHFSGKGTGKSEECGECPVLKEIEQIVKLDEKPLLIIDDLSYFRNPYNLDWPNQNELETLLKQKFDFKIFEDKTNDCLIAS